MTTYNGKSADDFAAEFTAFAKPAAKLPEDQTQNSQERWPYLVELAVTCGAGVLPNPCNGDILVTFTPYELKTFAEKVLSSQAEQIRKLEVEADKQEPTLWVDLLNIPAAKRNGLGPILCSLIPYDADYSPLFTRPPITSQRELELLEVIKQMRELIGKIPAERIGGGWYWLIEKALALTPDIGKKE